MQDFNMPSVQSELSQEIEPIGCVCVCARICVCVCAALWEKSYDIPRQRIKKQRHHFADKGPYSQSYDFSSSHLWM